MKNINQTQIVSFMVTLVIMGFFPIKSDAASNNVLSKGQLVYVPVYSHIYHGDREKKFDLTATLSIRNTNPEKDILLHSVDYFDSNGGLLKQYLDRPIVLKKFGSIRYVIKAKDKSGGSGAKFFVRWKSKSLVNAPLIEAIMISTQSQQGISFVSRGQAVRE